MITALLFPGQGSRLLPLVAWMLEDARFAPALVAAADAAGVRARDLVRGRALERTSVLQPVLVGASLALGGALREGGVDGEFVAGHSVGELAAVAHAGGMTASDAVRLAVVRGTAMEDAAREQGVGRMLAVLGEDAAHAEADVAEARALGGCEIAAWNAPDEVVLSGDRVALASIASRRESRWLDVAGAWHSRAMAPAYESFRAAADARSYTLLRIPLVRGVDGEIVRAVDPASLAEAILRPVQFTRVMRALAHADRFVTIGPGATLRALVRKNLGPSAVVFGTESPADLERTLEKLA